jgi:hypothetical protein
MGHLRVSSAQNRQVWDALRQYKDIKIKAGDLPGIGVFGAFIRWSASVKGVLTWLVGPDMSS